MTFTLTIQCDNAAFEDLGTELRLILTRAAKQMDETTENGDHRPVYDTNGNRVGDWTLKEGN